MTQRDPNRPLWGCSEWQALRCVDNRLIVLVRANGVFLAPPSMFRSDWCGPPIELEQERWVSGSSRTSFTVRCLVPGVDRVRRHLQGGVPSITFGPGSWKFRSCASASPQIVRVNSLLSHCIACGRMPVQRSQQLQALREAVAVALCCGLSRSEIGCLAHMARRKAPSVLRSCDVAAIARDPDG